ncbi:hypothetical protein [Peribacillus butanolivorans]|uniref:hypothetical protein n=1 Tax=Peribacillus butanolivorans TaxID=421767 RepID=UPI00366244B8
MELKGILTVIAGGDPEVLEKARPLLEIMNDKIIFWQALLVLEKLLKQLIKCCQVMKNISMVGIM